MKNRFLIIAVITILGCGDSVKKQAPEIAADVIYHNRDIVTMEGDTAQYVEALAVKDGLILKLGAKNEVLTLKGDSTKLVDLEGKSMLPGFIDGHAHFANFAGQAIEAQLLPPPDAGAKDIPTIIEILRE